MLLELVELPGGGVRLSVDTRGVGPACWAAIARLCPKLDALLAEAFPGLTVRAHLACPGCLRHGRWDCPQLWPLKPLLELEAARSFCKACGEEVGLAHPPSREVAIA